MRSERYLRVDGNRPPPPGPIAGVYKSAMASCACTPIFPSPRSRMQVAQLQAGAGRVQAALSNGTARRSRPRPMRAEASSLHALPCHGRQPLPWRLKIAADPITKIGEAAPKPWPNGDRPLAGLACSICRVMRSRCGADARCAWRRRAAVSGPEYGDPVAHHSTPVAASGRVCRTRTRRGEARCAIVAEARSFRKATRAVSRRGFSPEAAARIIPHHYGTLSALVPQVLGQAARLRYRWCRPRLDSTRRGQPPCRWTEGIASQMLDHNGYFMAFGAIGQAAGA